MEKEEKEGNDRKPRPYIHKVRLEGRVITDRFAFLLSKPPLPFVTTPSCGTGRVTPLNCPISPFTVYHSSPKTSPSGTPSSDGTVVPLLKQTEGTQTATQGKTGTTLGSAEHSPTRAKDNKKKSSEILRQRITLSKKLIYRSDRLKQRKRRMRQKR